ncbi:hypothetical protein, partial [Pseudomonas sp. GP01-A3]|uniref:hypothetical protein n=1 Tax=Pseudomonas sp. GP01-A3 TaxID=2070568 RepID=UPI001C462A46
MKETTSTAVEISGLNNGHTYYFAVTAVDSNGNESESVVSAGLVPHYDVGNASATNLTALSNGELNLALDSNVKAT